MSEKEAAPPMKGEQPEEGKKGISDDYKSYFFGWVTAILFSWANYILAYISHLGIKAIYAQWAGNFLYWGVFHIGHMIYGKYAGDSQPYFSKETSAYYSKTDKGYTLSIQKLMIPVYLSLVTGGIQATISETFNFAGKANVNAGVMGSIFCSSAIYTAIIFYFVYKQKMTPYDLAGCGLIVGSVFAISLSGTSGGDDSEIDTENLVYSTLMALVTGFLMSTQSLVLKKAMVDYQFPPRQIVFDGNLLLGVVLVPIYFIDQGKNDTHDFESFFLSNAQLLLVVLAIMSLTFGLMFGKGGPVQAIDQTKSIYQTIWGAIFLSSYPNWIQVGGMALGIIGIFFIILQPQQEQPKEEAGPETVAPAEKAVEAEQKPAGTDTKLAPEIELKTAGEDKTEAA